MRRIIIVFFSMALLMAVNIGCTKSTGSEEPGKKSSLETLRQKGSYIMGFQQARNLIMRQMDIETDPDAFIQGFKDGLKGQSQIEEKDKAGIYREYIQVLNERLEEKRKVDGEKNKAEGEQFLKENAQKQGVIVTPSGLQYLVLKEGTGPKPSSKDFVQVNYRGTLINGKEFDSSYQHGQPARFPLDRVIPAWTEGLQLMSVGAKYQLFCPPALAYGERGQGPDIGPNAVLIFEVELLGIEPPKPPTPEPAPVNKKP